MATCTLHTTSAYTNSNLNHCKSKSRQNESKYELHYAKIAQSIYRRREKWELRIWENARRKRRSRKSNKSTNNSIFSSGSFCCALCEIVRTFNWFWLVCNVFDCEIESRIRPRMNEIRCCVVLWNCGKLSTWTSTQFNEPVCCSIDCCYIYLLWLSCVHSTLKMCVSTFATCMSSGSFYFFFLLPLCSTYTQIIIKLKPWKEDEL